MTHYSTRETTPITEHISNIEHFPIFMSYLNQIERFLCYWMCKLEAYKSFLSVRSKGAMRETREEDVIVCFNIFEKIILSSFSLIFSSFFVRFEQFKKPYECKQLGFYKTSLYCKGKDSTIKDFKLEILICFNSIITKP